MIVEVREIVRCSEKFKVGDILRVRSKEIGEPIQTLPFKREDLLNVTTEQVSWKQTAFLTKYFFYQNK